MTAEAAHKAAAAPAEAGTAPRADALLATVWGLPAPATLHDADFRLLDANPAFTALVGRPRELLIGRDPVLLTPLEDHDRNLNERRDAVAAAAPGAPLQPLQRRLVDATGRERWFAAMVAPLCGSNGGSHGSAARWLTLWHEVTAEVVAREHARRAQDELGQWFELSGTGMLVYDDSGLILRCNAAFESLLEHVPEVLDQAAPELQALLGWHGGALLPGLVAGAPAIENQVVARLPGGRRRRLSARLACHAGEQGERRVMAVVQDRSAEDERDLAQLEMGMLMDTASIGVATYDPTLGWLAPAAAATGAPAAAGAAGGGAAAGAGGSAGTGGGSTAAASGALLSVGRELVEPASLPEFERLQKALRSGERTEVRYAVRHPELGARWLLTRVEPRALAGGRTTTSVVTLDVTDQERAQRRNEQLLRELTTILDSSTAGIAYLRGPVLVRCNRRFERMLGFDAGGAAGASLAEIFARSVGAPAAAQALQALERLDQLAEPDKLGAGQPYETELQLPGAGAGPRWYSLSVRRAQADGQQAEAVAVLTDITRLKTQQAELEQLLRDRELMFSLSEVGIVYQRGARIERANQAMAALTGWASPELTTLDAAELYEDARACVDFEARIAQALREQGRFSGERLLRRRDGRLLWVQVAVRPVDADASGSAPRSAPGVICSFVDIDERRRARETLASQAERTRAILNSVLVGIVTVSDNGIQWMNRSARRMFAGELADFVGEPVSTVATAEPDHPLRRTDMLQRLQEGQNETFECRLKGRDGREFWVVGNAVLTGHGSGDGGSAGPADAGGGRELTIALLDIERRRQAEVSIAQAQASLQRVIETAPLAIALFDARTLRVQQLNLTASSFFGRPLQVALGGTPEENNAPAKAAALRQWLQAVAASGLASQHEWRDAADGDDRSDGPTQPARVWDCRIAPLEDAAVGGVAGGGPGGAAQLLLVASDVTEQRAAERARLQAAIDQREVLVREVHHRIKNNLQGVAGLLQQNAARHPELAGALNEAVGQVQAIAQVYGLQVGSHGPIVVASLLRAIAASVQRTFGCTIAVDVQGSVPHLLPEAEAIPVALTVNELLINAVKHSRGAARGGAGESADAGADADRADAIAAAVEVRCSLRAAGPAAGGAGPGDAVQIHIASQAVLPEGFDLHQVRGGVSGLGLVRALLPRRSATLSLQQQGRDVVASVELRPPGVRVPEPVAVPRSAGESAPQSAA